MGSLPPAAVRARRRHPHRGTDPDWFDDKHLLDGHQLTLSKLTAGQQFVYVFDLGDNWTHLCTVGEHRIDPLETLGIVPARPLPYWGWGEIPDQYGRRFDRDDGETPIPPIPGSPTYHHCNLAPP